MTLDAYITGAAAFAAQSLQKQSDLAECLELMHVAFGKLTAAWVADSADMSLVFTKMTHAAFLAAVTLAASGQIPSSAMVMRGCLESALYGFYIHFHPEFFDVWAARHKSEHDARRMKSIFKIGPIKVELRRRDQRVADRTDIVYDHAIDLGGHPNVHAMLAYLMRDESVGLTWQHVVLEEVGLRTGLLWLAFTGLVTFEILDVAYPELIDRSGVDVTIASLHERLGVIAAQWLDAQA